MISDDSPDDSFYKEVVDLIRKWLGDREYSLILEEFKLSDTYFDTLSPRAKLMALLRFIEVNYIQLPKRISTIYEYLDKLNESMEIPIEDFEIPDTFGKNVSLASLKGKMKDEDEKSLAALFQELLKAAGLSKIYEKYRNGLSRSEGRLNLDE